jgi:poly(3-hydroxybutyrate) depolymerase
MSSDREGSGSSKKRYGRGRRLLGCLITAVTAVAVTAPVAAQAQGDPTTSTSSPARPSDFVSVVVAGAHGYSVSGPVRTGGISVLDNIASHQTETVSGSATLANGAAFAVSVHRSTTAAGYVGALSVSGRQGFRLDTTVGGGLTRPSNDTVVWTGPATIHDGKQVFTRTVTVTIVDRVPDPGDHVLTIQHAGVTRYVAVHVPVGKGGVTGLASVVHFPGLLESALFANLFSQLFTASDRFGYLAVIPEHHGYGWQGVPAGTLGPDVDDIGFARVAMAEVQARFHPDPARIYSTGLSNGSWFSQKTACQLSDVFAAWADVSGPLVDIQDCHPGRPVPMLMFHGTKDPLVPYDTEARSLAFWAANNGCSTTTTDTDLPDVDPTDGTTVIKHVYNGCPAKAPLVFYEIDGGGHQWPDGNPFPPFVGNQTRDIHGNEIIWDFLSQFRLPKGA